jgi:hypothetical protein
VPRVSLRTLAALFVVLVVAGGAIIAATRANVAYLGPVMFFAIAVIATVALLEPQGPG